MWPTAREAWWCSSNGAELTRAPPADGGRPLFVSARPQHVAALADRIDQGHIDTDEIEPFGRAFSFASDAPPRLNYVDLKTRAADQMGILSKTCLAAAAVTLLAASLYAGAQKPSHDEDRARDSDICGYQLMTERERAQYRERLQHGGSAEELERILSEHREQMQARAKERGVVLSCDKPGEVRQIRATGALKSEGGAIARSSSPAVIAVRAESEGGNEGR